MSQLPLHPAFAGLELAPPPFGNDPDAMTLGIANMTCHRCVEAVHDTLSELPGVWMEHVSVGHARLRMDVALANPAAVIEALRAEGYPAGFLAPTAVPAPVPTRGRVGTTCCSLKS